MPFKKGQSGNPKGRKKGVPNKATVEVKEWARSVLEDEKVREKTLTLAQVGRLSPALVIELFNRAYGKVKDVQDTTLKVAGQVVNIFPPEKKAP